MTKIMSVIFVIASLVGLGFVIVKNFLSIIQTIKNKKLNKSNQDNEGGDI